MSPLKYNFEIPGWKSRDEIEIASQLAHSSPPNSTIVEVGACAGRITWHVSQNASPGSKVYAIDLWDRDLMFVGKGYRLDCTQENTLDYFWSFMEGCTNVETLQGDSLLVPWQKPVDLVFVDPDLGPGRSDDLYNHFLRWLGFLKPGGIIAGFNYFKERSDVRNAVDRLGAFMKAEVHTSHNSPWQIRSRL